MSLAITFEHCNLSARCVKYHVPSAFSLERIHHKHCITAHLSRNDRCHITHAQPVHFPSHKLLPSFLSVQSIVNYSFCEPEVDLKTEFLSTEKDLPVIESSKEFFVQL